MANGEEIGAALLSQLVGAIDRWAALPAGPVVVAFSGGPDSLCLLHLLADLAPRRGWRLTAAHLDHGLRPESVDEVAVVRALAAARGLPSRTARVDVRALAAASGEGIEAAARRARYRFLATVAAELTGGGSGAGPADRAPVVVAHTQDDQAETLLLRLARGSGLTGLAAMRPVAVLPPAAWGGPAGPPLRVVRPLLGVSRAVVEAELARRGLTPLRDPSNAELGFARNRLRHRLLPTWQALDPGIAARLARAADLLAEDDAYLDAETDRVWQQVAHAGDESGGAPGRRVALDRRRFLDLPVALQRRLLRRATKDWGDVPTLGAIDSALAVAGGPAGGMASLLAGCTLFVEAERLWIGVRPGAPRGPWMVAETCLPLNLDGTTRLPGAPWQITCRRVASAVCDVPPSGRHAHFAPSLGDLTPCLRTWRRGDRIARPGVDGRTKLSDFFIDRKVPRHERTTVPLVVAGAMVAWVVGYAVGEPYRAHGDEAEVFCCQVLPS